MEEDIPISEGAPGEVCTGAERCGPNPAPSSYARPDPWPCHHPAFTPAPDPWPCHHPAFSAGEAVGATADHSGIRGAGPDAKAAATASMMSVLRIIAFLRIVPLVDLK